MNLRVGSVAAAGLVILLSSPASAEPNESGTTTAKTSAEAWYTTVGVCETPADCSPVPPQESPAYPENTLHVDIKSGQPTATTYLQLDTSAMPFGAKITGGTLTLPIDEEATHGSLTPEAAQLAACAVTEPVEEAQGSTSEPPKTDCKAASASARFKKGKNPAFAIDVTEFASQWSESGTASLAILPAPKAESERETWHVTFWGKDNKDPKAKPISAELNYSASDSALPPPIDDVAVPEPAAVAPPGDADMPAPKAPAPEPAEPPKAKPKPEQPENAPEPELAPQAMPTLREVGYSYPTAWLAPLALLVGFGVTGRTLTKNLAPEHGTTSALS